MATSALILVVLYMLVPRGNAGGDKTSEGWSLSNIVETITNNVPGLAGVKSGVSNVFLLSRLERKLDQVQHRTQLNLVSAFAAGIIEELNGWMPTEVKLANVNMKSNGRYICGSHGVASNVLSLKVLESEMDLEESPQSDRLNVLVRFTFEDFKMNYKHFVVSTATTPHTTGKLDLRFSANETTIGFNIPNIVTTPVTDFQSECLVIFRSLTVTKLDYPEVNYETDSIFGKLAERIIELFAKRFTDSFKSIVQLSVMKLFSKLLKVEEGQTKHWLCTSQSFENSISNAAVFLQKRSSHEKFVKYCSKEADNDDLDFDNAQSGDVDEDISK